MKPPRLASDVARRYEWAVGLFALRSMVRRYMRSFFARGGPSVIEDEDLARSLAVITDPATLRSSIAERVRQLTGSDRAHICSLGPDKRMFVADPNGSPTTDPIAFAADSALVKWLRVNEAPFTIPHPSGALEYLGADERE